MTRLLPLCFALLFAACADAEAPTTGTLAPTGPASAVGAPAAHSEKASGEGALPLAGTSYAFDVAVCDLSGEADTDYQTLVGRGTAPDGEPFEVFVSRNDIGDILTHTVSYQSGDVRRGQGTVIAAQRMRMGGTWSSVRGGSAGPLVVIAGNRITAEGQFSSDDALSATVPGRLEAPCN